MVTMMPARGWSAASSASAGKHRQQAARRQAPEDDRQQAARQASIGSEQRVSRHAAAKAEDQPSSAAVLWWPSIQVWQQRSRAVATFDPSLAAAQQCCGSLRSTSGTGIEDGGEDGRRLPLSAAQRLVRVRGVVAGRHAHQHEEQSAPSRFEPETCQQREAAAAAGSSIRAAAGVQRAAEVSGSNRDGVHCGREQPAAVGG